MDLPRNPQPNPNLPRKMVFSQMRPGNGKNSPCLFDYSAAKTTLQCCYKMEKLRRRHRSESQGPASASPWPYYEAMEALEHGPLPISARPLTKFVPSGHDNDYENDVVEEDEEEDNDEEESQFSKSRSINYILRRPSLVNRFSGFLSGGRKRVRAEEEGNEDVAAVEVEEENRGAEIAAEIKRFAKRVMRVERKRVEMMQEMEMLRMQMENRRIEMILESQRKIVDVIAATLGSEENCVKVEEEFDS